MKRNRRVKIVATLGPASANPDVMARLFEAGADVFRINMSHTPHDEAWRLRDAIRGVEARFGRPIGILADLQGPKLRIGEMLGGRALLQEGSLFRFDASEAAGNAQRVGLPHPPIFAGVEVGHVLLLDDGKVRMQVVEKRADRIEAKVLTGGALASRKGISLPDTVLPLGPLTAKDQADLANALDIGADWIALSFVQRSEDVAEVRRLVDGRAAIMSKIEKPSAIADLEQIINLSDGIMVARGDLGVEMPVEKVPGLQKRITRQARGAGKPVVIATQMLESMIVSPVPTRAEVSDVATAVFDGADAVMLSAESAVGKYPAEAITVMDRIGVEVEHDPSYDAIIHATRTAPEATSHDAIAQAAHAVGDTLKVAAIVCYTATGSTALRVARERPSQPVLALSPVQATVRRLAVAWGMHCVLTSDPVSMSDVADKACRVSREEGFAKVGERIIITAGVPLGTPGTTNTVRIARVGEQGILTR
jgi:pyruvate kinase